MSMNMQAIQETDRQLLAGIANADARQVKRLYTDHLPAIIRYVRQNSGTEEEARDLFQDATMLLYKKLRNEGLVLTVPFSAWFQAVCRNLWLSKLRRQRGKTSTPLTYDAIDPDPSWQEQEEALQTENLFHKHFERLGESCREILKLYFRKTPVKAIAEAMNTSESYIKKRKHQCKDQLIKAVQSDPLYKSLRP